MCFQKLKLESSIRLVTFDHNDTFLTGLTQVDTQVEYLLVLFGTLVSLLLHVLEDPGGSGSQITITDSVNVTHVLQQITFLVQPLECFIPTHILQPDNAVWYPGCLEDADHTHFPRVVAVGAAACFSVYTFDLHHPDVGGRDSAALLQVHPLFEFSVFLVHKCFGNFIVIIHNCIGIVFDLPFLRVGNGDRKQCQCSCEW